MWEDAKDKSGKIVAMINTVAPYQNKILRQIEAGAIAVVVYRDRGDLPGQGMYYTRIGFDEMRLTVPVVEAFEKFKLPKSLHKFKSRMPASGIQVAILPEENQWKKANDVTAFQVTFNVILSLLEVAIILIAIYRLSLWVRFSASGLVAIGPVCLLLEMISAILRFACTVVDPFLTFRTMPSPFGDILITMFLPFQLASGILLTFYWAETLTTNKVSAVPFISEHKVICLIVIAILFIGEIASASSRSVTAISSFNPVYVSQAFYVIVAAILTICYVACAIQISRRLSRSSVSKASLRALNLRFTISTSGYIAFIILNILLVVYFGAPWGFKIIFNLVFLFSNLTGLLQVYSFVPPQFIKSTKKSAETPSGTAEVPKSVAEK